MPWTKALRTLGCSRYLTMKMMESRIWERSFSFLFNHLCSCCPRHCEQWVAELQLKDFESLFQLYFCTFLYISSFCFHCPHLFPANANFVYAPPDSNYLSKMLYIRENIIHWTWFKYACDLRWTVNISQTTADFLVDHVAADEDVNPRSTTTPAFWLRHPGSWLCIPPRWLHIEPALLKGIPFTLIEAITPSATVQKSLYGTE